MKPYFLLNILFISFTFTNTFFYFHEYQNMRFIFKFANVVTVNRISHSFGIAHYLVASAKAWINFTYFISVVYKRKKRKSSLYFEDGVLVAVQLNPGTLDAQNAMFTAFLQVVRVENLLWGEYILELNIKWFACIQMAVGVLFVCTQINQERNWRLDRFIFTFTVIPHVLSQLVSLVVHDLNSLNCL